MLILLVAASFSKLKKCTTLQGVTTCPTEREGWAVWNHHIILRRSDFDQLSLDEKLNTKHLKIDADYYIKEMERECFKDFINMEILEFIGQNNMLSDSACNGLEKLQEIKGLKSASIGTSACENCISLKSVSGGTTSIANRAFFNCISLTKIDVSVESIGDSVFENCISLISDQIRLSGSISNLGSRAFYNCTSLTYISLGVNDAGAEVFSYCTNLVNVRLWANSLKTSIFSNCVNLVTANVAGAGTIDNNFFLNCNKLTNLILEGNPTINNNAFQSHPCLANITISVSSVGDNAFSGCLKLANVVMSGGKPSIGARAFADCPLIEVINCEANSVGSECFVGCNLLREVRIKTAELIGDSAFNGCENLVRIEFDAISYGNYAFNQCNKLSELKMTKAASFGTNAFAGCISITDFSMSVINIGDYAFMNCIGITSVTLRPTGTVGNQVFLNCSKLSQANIIESDSSLGNRLFENCIMLETVTINARSIGNDPFLNTIIKTADITLGSQFHDRILRSFETIEVLTLNVGSIADNATEKCYNLKTLIITSGNIGNSAFSECTNLHTLQISSGNIGDSCFKDCSKLETVTFSKIGTIGSKAFQNCIKLPSLSFSTSSVGQYAFDNCVLIETMAISATEVLAYAFNGCKALKSVTINNCDIVEKFALNGCVSVEELTCHGSNFPTSDLTIFPNLKNLYMDGIRALKASDLINCNQLKDVSLKSVTDVPDQCFLNKKELGFINIEGTLIIGAEAFKGCSKLGSIRLSQDLKTLKKSCFEGCSSILDFYYYYDKNIFTKGFYYHQLPNTVTDIAPRSFAYCTSLAEFSLSYCPIIRLEDSLFEGCKSLKSFTHRNEINAIGDSCFKDCIGFTGDYDLPEYLLTIGDHAFEGCINIGKVKTNSDIKTIGAFCFKDCTTMGAIDIRDTLIDVGESAFEGCTSLNNPNHYSSRWNGNTYYNNRFPNAVKVIKKRLFYGCTNLKKFEMTAVETVEEEAFKNSGVSTITLNSIMTSIGKSAFENCDSLERINLMSAPIRYIKERCFSNCNSLVAVENIGAITEIEPYAFYNSTRIVSFTIPSSVETIGDYAFYGTSLLRIEIPSSVLSIGKFTFKGNKKINEITVKQENTHYKAEGNVLYNNGMTEALFYPEGNVNTPDIKSSKVNGHAFSNCSFTSLTINDNVQTIEQYAFSRVPLTNVKFCKFMFNDFQYPAEEPTVFEGCPENIEILVSGRYPSDTIYSLPVKKLLNAECVIPLPTDAFSYSIAFSYSSPFTHSKDFSFSRLYTKSIEFSQTVVFTETKEFSCTNSFSQSGDFKASDFFSKSLYFAKSKEFSNSNHFTNTEKFISTIKFSTTSSFELTKDFSSSEKYTPTNQFSKSNIFSETKGFTRTEQFDATKSFTISDKFKQTKKFSKSNKFEKTTEFSKSVVFTKTMAFSQTEKFSGSKTFTNTFTPSNKFSLSDKFKQTSLFTKSDLFKQSDYFSSSNLLKKEESNENYAKEKDTKTSINPASLVGIIVGIVAVVVILIIILIFMRRGKKESEINDQEFETTYDDGSYTETYAVTEDPYSINPAQYMTNEVESTYDQEIFTTDLFEETTIFDV